MKKEQFDEARLAIMKTSETLQISPPHIVFQNSDVVFFFVGLLTVFFSLS